MQILVSSLAKMGKITTVSLGLQKLKICQFFCLKNLLLYHILAFKKQKLSFSNLALSAANQKKQIQKYWQTTEFVSERLIM